SGAAWKQSIGDMAGDEGSSRTQRVDRGRPDPDPLVDPDHVRRPGFAELQQIRIRAGMRGTHENERLGESLPLADRSKVLFDREVLDIVLKHLESAQARQAGAVVLAYIDHFHRPRCPLSQTRRLTA